MQRTAIDHRHSYPFQPVNTFSHERLSEIESLDAVLDEMARLHREHPGQRFLCTLDDLGQCCYTSMHAQDHDALGIDSTDVDHDDPEARHAYEGRVLQHIAAQLANPQLRVSWDALPDVLEAEDEALQALIAANRDPSRVLDEVVYIQRVPLADDNLLIAGLPNGYFSCDLNIFQNHAVIRRMADEHGYRFFGIGASWLGFVRPQPLDATGVERLIGDLSFLYRRPVTSDPAWHELADLLVTRTVLLLGYTEDFDV